MAFGRELTPKQAFQEALQSAHFKKLQDSFELFFEPNIISKENTISLSYLIDELNEKFSKYVANEDILNDHLEGYDADNQPFNIPIFGNASLTWHIVDNKPIGIGVFVAAANQERSRVRSIDEESRFRLFQLALKTFYTNNLLEKNKVRNFISEYFKTSLYEKNAHLSGKERTDAVDVEMERDKEKIEKFIKECTPSMRKTVAEEGVEQAVLQTIIGPGSKITVPSKKIAPHITFFEKGLKEATKKNQTKKQENEPLKKLSHIKIKEKNTIELLQKKSMA